MFRLLCCSLVATLVSACASTVTTDRHLWLEDVTGEQALEWVRQQNTLTFDELKHNPLFEELYAEAYAVLTSDARIPEGAISGEYFYSFWQDKSAVRGIWRRTKISDFIDGAPSWETMLDVDELAKRESENWVYQGSNCLGGGSDRCLIELSRGGKDESVYREFSLSDKSFVADGFLVPDAKSDVAWAGEDHLLVTTDWGDDSLTNSGYPREARLWRRNTELTSARPLFVADKKDTLLAPVVYHSNDTDYAFLLRVFADWNETSYLPLVNGTVSAPLDIPLKASIEGVIHGLAIVNLEEDWSVHNSKYQSGDVVSLHLQTLKTELIFSPSKTQAVSNIEVGENSVFIQLLDNVVGRIKRSRHTPTGWRAEDIRLPANGVAALAATSSSRDDLFASFESTIQPTTLYHISKDDQVSEVAALDALYDATDIVVRQQFVPSADGESVPYFLIGHREVLARGDAPTILYGYGGFLIPTLPVYYQNPSRPQHGALAGKMWLSRGGVLALANIRGGGEYGPDWHQSALRENRQRAFDDYFAIAEDLIRKGVTRSDKLGALGRSNGGLLLGVALTQRPELFAALDIGAPLLDMKRYSLLLAGSSWIGEYGNPEIAADWAFIKNYSPYQNLRKGQVYPKVFFYTSTQDDRVHPGHARKMAARLAELGQAFYYYENTEGGHSGTANQEQLAMRTALEYRYFIHMLMGE